MKIIQKNILKKILDKIIFNHNVIQIGHASSLISNQRELLEICAKIEQTSFVALDTEFMRETTYYPLLCLIQININNDCFAIDTLAKDIDLTPFFKILSNPKIKKIFHSARQDIEILKLCGAEIITGVVDTQIMANFCGFNHNIGYANLVKKLLKKNLDKKWQRSNWQARPLNLGQINYALIDVFYLAKTYQILQKKLQKTTKSQWFMEEMNYILENSNYDVEKRDLYKNFAFGNKSTDYQNKIKALIIWRNQLAKQYNLTHNLIIRDKILIKIIDDNPSNIEELRKYRLSPNLFNQKLQRKIIELLANQDLFKQEIDDKIVNNRHYFRLNQKQQFLYQEAKILLTKKAKIHNISQEMIINQSDLRRIIIGHKEISKILFGWRDLVFGQDLRKKIP